MTEAEWLSCSEPRDMLLRRDGRSERQLVLFGCACCRRQWHLLPDDYCRHAVQSAEEWVVGLRTTEELRRARDDVASAHPNMFWTADYREFFQLAAYFAAFDQAAADEFEVEHGFGEDPAHIEHFDDILPALKYDLGVNIGCALVNREEDDSKIAEQVFNGEMAAQCDLLRDIFGNPFRPVALDPSWRTSTVVALAEGIYADRAFDRLPVLADALEDAGCDHPDIMAHCRSGGPHARGCWVVDLLLGNE